MKPCGILEGKVSRNVQKLELESFVGNGVQVRGLGQENGGGLFIVVFVADGCFANALNWWGG
jgi:hypothetical protein